MQCARCSSTETRRSSRRGIETLLSLIGIWPYRCERCDARFLRFARTRARERTRLHA